MMREMEKHPMTVAAQDDTFQVENTILNNESLVKKLSFLHQQMPSLCYHVIQSCPDIDEPKNLETQVPSSIYDLFQEESKPKYRNFISYTSEEWYKPWQNLEDFYGLLHKLLAFFAKIPSHNIGLIEQSCDILTSILQLFGCEFSKKELLKIILNMDKVNVSIVFNSYLHLEQDVAFKLVKSWIENDVPVAECLKMSLKTRLKR